MKKVKKKTPKIVIFTAVKNRCMLHGRVFIMKQELHIHVSERSIYQTKTLFKKAVI